MSTVEALLAHASSVRRDEGGPFRLNANSVCGSGAPGLVSLELGAALSSKKENEGVGSTVEQNTARATSDHSEDFFSENPLRSAPGHGLMLDSVFWGRNCPNKLSAKACLKESSRLMGSANVGKLSARQFGDHSTGHVVQDDRGLTTPSFRLQRQRELVEPTHQRLLS